MRLVPFSFKLGFWQKPIPLTSQESARYRAMLGELRDIHARLDQLKQKAEQDFFSGGDTAICELIFCDSWRLAMKAEKTALLVEREINRGVPTN